MDPRNFNENVFSMLHPQGALLVAGDLKQANVMTISWGQVGIMWHKSIFIIYVRPNRHTLTFIQKNLEFTINIMPIGSEEILKFCGTHSGKDTDKFQACKLTKIASQKIKTPSIKEALVSFECRVLYQDRIKKENFINQTCLGLYPKQDFHHVFWGEILEMVKIKYGT